MQDQSALIQWCLHSRLKKTFKEAQDSELDCWAGTVALSLKNEDLGSFLVSSFLIQETIPKSFYFMISMFLKSVILMKYGIWKVALSEDSEFSSCFLPTSFLIYILFFNCMCTLCGHTCTQHLIGLSHHHVGPGDWPRPGRLSRNAFTNWTSLLAHKPFKISIQLQEILVKIKFFS